MPPEGNYKNIRVTNAYSGRSSLSNGTGRYTNGVLSCGPFEPDDLPPMGQSYTIAGTHDADRQSYTFSEYTCVNSGATSDFRESRSARSTRVTQRN